MVEWKKLGEVCLETNNIKWKMEPNDKVYMYIDLSSVGIESHKIENTTEICKEIAPSRAQQIVKDGDVLLGTTRPTLRRYCQVSKQYDNQICSTGFCVYRVNKDIILNRWLFHNISDNRFWDYCEQRQKGAGYPCLSNNDAFAYTIPIPSLSEQQHIVGILDTFTTSISNLKEQLALRRKQYEHYRDELLDLEGKEGVEMKTLGEVGSFIRGSGIQKADFVEIGKPCIHYGQIHTKYSLSAKESFSFIDECLYNKCKKAVKGDVVLATTSEDAEGCAKPVAWLGEEDVAISGDAIIYHHNQNGKFIAHHFATHRFLQFKIMNVTGAKVVRISGDTMAKYEVPLPSLEEQSRIVSLLDTFEASISNLEAQIAAREKQYEYYRNKLLTFE